MRVVNAWVQDSAIAAAATTTTTAKRATTWSLVDPERDYSLTTISYVSSGQDGYAVIPANAQNVQTTVRTAENVHSLATLRSLICWIDRSLLSRCIERAWLRVRSRALPRGSS